MKEPAWIDIDWARGFGMIKGEIIEKTGNVMEVRFKTVDVKSQ